MDITTRPPAILNTLDAQLALWVESSPDRAALVVPDFSLSYAALGRAVAAARTQLQGLGMGRGDVLAFQLPNWIEAFVLFHAAVGLGAVAVPILPSMREHELAFMLRECSARLFVTTPLWRRIDHAALARQCCQASTAIALVDEGALRRGEALLRAVGHGECASAEDEMAVAPASLGAGEGLHAVCSMIFTSGTSGRPKAVVYSHQGLAVEGREMAAVDRIGAEDRLFVPPSIAHVSGISFGICMPLAAGCTVCLLPEWEPAAAIDFIARERCTWTAGATPFLQGVVDSAEARSQALGGLKVFRCGGASVPPGLVRRARALGMDAYRSYGLSEHPTVSGRAGQDESACLNSDGMVHPLIETRVVDMADASREMPPGESGEILLRGPDQSLGYLRAADNLAIRRDGWLSTGDIGKVDADRIITITGRKKDIIIRKGENIAARELEDIIGENPNIQDVAVVGMPDAERGEMVCAVVVPRASATLHLADINGPLRQAGVAAFKLPERLVCLESLPYNAGGKVQKTAIRQLLLSRAVC